TQPAGPRRELGEVSFFCILQHERYADIAAAGAAWFVNETAIICNFAHLLVPRIEDTECVLDAESPECSRIRAQRVECGGRTLAPPCMQHLAGCLCQPCCGARGAPTPGALQPAQALGSTRRLAAPHDRTADAGRPPEHLDPPVGPHRERDDAAGYRCRHIDAAAPSCLERRVCRGCGMQNIE